MKKISIFKFIPILLLIIIFIVFIIFLFIKDNNKDNSNNIDKKDLYFNNNKYEEFEMPPTNDE